MDLVHDTPTTIAQEEDRISNLGDDIIHRILGFLDIKYAIQTSKLSRRWKRIWTSMPNLNLDTHTFGSLPEFAKFVKHVLSHRNTRTPVFALKLAFTGNPTHSVFKRIFDYAYSHDVSYLSMICFGIISRRNPQFVFSCHTLKHLTLRNEVYRSRSFFPNSAWDFPALETLNLTLLQFFEGEFEDNNVNLFSKCVNLKDLTLHLCTMSGVHIFNVCTPKLSNLTITGSNGFPKVFNVVATQLENFTASIISHNHCLRLSTAGFDSLEKVNLSSSWNNVINKRYIPPLLDLFKKLRSAKFLSLDVLIIEALSRDMDEVSHEPCPFNNLKCVKIDITQWGPLSAYINRRDHTSKMVPQVRKYLLKNSPDATFIIDIPQVPPMRVKRPMQTHNDTMANKMAKLDVPSAEPSSTSRSSSSDVPLQISRQQVHNDVKKMANLEASNKQPETRFEDKKMLKVKIQMQNQLIAEQKTMFEAKIQMQDNVTAKQKATYEAKLQMQDEVIAKQKATFEAKIQMQDDVIAKQEATFEAKLQNQNEVIAKQKATIEAKIQMQDDVIAKQKATFEAKLQMQDEVIAKQKAMYEGKIEAAKLQHEKLMSLIIKSKIAELKVKIESGSPSHEVIHSTGVDIGSVMDLIPESLKVKLEARFSLMYEGFKSLFLTHFDDSQWEMIESQLEKEYKAFLD